jgi:hypothetical protein
LGAFDRSEIQIRPHEHGDGDQGQRQSDSAPLQHQLIAVGLGAKDGLNEAFGTSTGQVETTARPVEAAI